MTDGAGPRPLRLAVVGDPVAHSASPALQRELLGQAGLAGTYEAIRVPAGCGAAAIEALRARGYHGLNVTTPLKEEAFARADTRDPAALASRSLNTLVLGAAIAGFNTDGLGALGALRDAGLRGPAGCRVLVLGAGPTARSACVALAAAGAAVYVWNRTPASARDVARDFGLQVFAAAVAYDAVFAALPPHATLDEPAVRAAALAAPRFVDANYGQRATLGAWLGRDVTDGLAMLRHSAAASLAVWRSAWEAGAGTL